VAVIPLVRDTPALLAVGVIFGILNFARTRQFRRRTGVSPWHVHPVVWGVVSLCISLIGTVLAAVAIATTKVPRRDPAPPRPTGTGVAAASGVPAGAVLAYGPAPGWHPDPAGRHHHRFWSGSRWTDHVANGGVPSIDPVPPAVAVQAGAPLPAAESPLPPFRRP